MLLLEQPFDNSETMDSNPQIDVFEEVPPGHLHSKGPCYTWQTHSIPCRKCSHPEFWPGDLVSR